ncbi:HK97 family phage prohead protease [Roseinatronobacter sp.]|uniref:HK97 family phage prohead protease n=1 Tax=Roseinatronobacter sp. TaxID=1945755 RepID=UPI0025DC88BB|nr:HK97 family phage prohead protease [Roseibaca sp.]
MLEYKFAGAAPGLRVVEGHEIAGYASIFGQRDRGGDTVVAGAYAASLARLAASGDQVRMLWQHDPSQPIGVWDEVREDAVGLYVKGRLLPDVTRAREAQALLAAGAVDGLSIGYRTLRAEKLPGGGRRLLELDLWEVSLVTFPMQSSARIDRKSDAAQDIALLTAKLSAARAALAQL